MVDLDKKKVAKGATLFSKGTKERVKNPRSRLDMGKIKSGNPNLNIAESLIKPIRDEKYKKQVIQFLGQHGVEVTSYKERYITRRVKVRLGRLRIDSYKQYLSYISENPQEIRYVKESLSINVTRFFRNRDTFDLIKEKIFPALLNRAIKLGRSELSIWSAGCAVGAEPYSIAILASDTIAQDIKVHITATDVKNELITIAKNAKYNEQYLAEMERHEVLKHFQKISDENYEVLQTTRKLVSFRQHDLLRDSYPNNLDMIICRNVLIYVDRDTQLEIVGKFFNSLRPGGVLVLGRTETLFGDWRNEVDIVSTKHRIYQKKIDTSSIINIDVTDKKVKITKGKKSPRIITKPKTRLTITPNQTRLEELRNYRKIFEERKALWDSRIDSQQKELDSNVRQVSKPQPRKLKTRIDFMDRLRPTHQNTKTNFSASKSIENTKIPLNKTEFDSIKIKPLRGQLSNYRSLLLKTKSPIRQASVRINVKDRLSDKISYKQTPEEIYKTIMRKKKLRE